MADFGETHWESQDSFSPSVGNTIPISTFNSNSSYTVVGNMAATSDNTTITPPCKASLVAYPEGISSANGGSSTTVWCSAGPPSLYTAEG